MWMCHKCQKPVYFAERKQSIGHDWHPECLKCEECGKVLKPGQHAEHKGAPYCHVPCYGALFGPQLFGHGTKVESHKSFGRPENKLYNGMTRSHLEAAIKLYNNYYEVHGGCGGVKSREVNGRIVLEGVLRLYWGIHSAIRLQENDDEASHSNGPSLRKTPAKSKQEDSDTENIEESQGQNSVVVITNGTRDHKPYPAAEEVESEIKEANGKTKDTEYSVKSYRTNQLRRRPGQRFDKTKLKRRCSINGHVYNRETSVFTPPYGSTMSVWTTSLVSTQEVINMLLEKYRVESSPSNFSLFVVKYNGERKRIRDDEYPLLLRVTQGPDESVSKFFLVERSDSNEVSAAVAQFIHLSEPELQSILRLYCDEEEREIEQIRKKHEEMRRRILKRLDGLKVKL